MAGPGTAGLGVARRGAARHGVARQGNARQCNAGGRAMADPLMRWMILLACFVGLFLVAWALVTSGDDDRDDDEPWGG